MTSPTSTSTSAAPSAPQPAAPRKKITVPDLARLTSSGERIAMVTAYDATFARLVDRAGVDVILVGDSLGMVVQGGETTIPVSLEEMAYHVRLVAQARPRALVVGDMPFGSYQVSPQQAVAGAVELMKSGAECVKLEGGINMAETIAAISRVDIPVMGHIGLTPQSVHRMGGHRVQGRRSGFEPGSRERLLDDAHAVEQSGACAVVVEGVPAELAADISDKLTIPTIGIGAGAACDGQVLVLHDLLGLSDMTLKFAKAYADLGAETVRATAAYVDEVRRGLFPDDAHSFH